MVHLFPSLVTCIPKKALPSLSNPPSAPKKRTPPLWRPWVVEKIRILPSLIEEEQLRQEERREYETWHIRSKYLRWTPMEIERIDDRDLLHFLHQKYAFPASQPRNEEEVAYLQLMSEAILNRLLNLNTFTL